MSPGHASSAPYFTISTYFLTKTLHLGYWRPSSPALAFVGPAAALSPTKTPSPKFLLLQALLSFSELILPTCFCAVIHRTLCPRSTGRRSFLSSGGNMVAFRRRSPARLRAHRANLRLQLCHHTICQATPWALTFAHV